MSPNPASLTLALIQHIDKIVDTLYVSGWAIVPDFLPLASTERLLHRANSIDEFTPAGVGRGDRYRENKRIRKDKIFWLDDTNPTDRLWLEAMEFLRLAINRYLFLGLFEFETHYAHYEPGDYYLRHKDAFKGQGNRLVTVVLYLNPEWQDGDAGELVIYPASHPDGVQVLPKAGTLVVFLSEDFSHEVLPTNRDRYSITGWFRLNSTTATHLDVPQLSLGV